MFFLRPLLFFACFFGAVAAELVAQDDARRFVVPEDRSQVLFPAATQREPERQLQNIAAGFAMPVGKDGLQNQDIENRDIESPNRSPVSQTAHFQTAGSSKETQPIATASMGRADSSRIVPAAVTAVDFDATKPKIVEPIEPKRLETQPIGETSSQNEEGRGVPSKLGGKGKASLLDVPISLKRAEDKGKLTKPIMGGAAPLFSVFVSLAIVLAAFFLLVLLLRKASPKGSRQLPQELCENLGRIPLTPKQNLHLLRLGNRLILVSVSLDGVQPITEITDPDEVVMLLGLCRRQDPHSSTQLFKKVLSDVSTEQADAIYGTPAAKPRTKSKPKSASTLDLYSEPDESLASLLASGFKGGHNG